MDVDFQADDRLVFHWGFLFQHARVICRAPCRVLCRPGMFAREISGLVTGVKRILCLFYMCPGGDRE